MRSFTSKSGVGDFAFGGTAFSPMVAGGTVELESGSVVSGAIIFSGGGTLEIFGAAMPSATISGFTSGDTIDLASVASAAGGTAVLTSGNVLDVTEGGSTYVLALDPSKNYAGTVFALASDGSGGVDVTNILNPISVTVSSGQTLTVSSGHTSNSVLVLSGATLNVLSGGTASGAFINKGGSGRVSGRDVGATLSGGLEVVSRTGIASGTTVRSGGSQTDLGVTVSTMLVSGAEIVSSGGTASSTVVSNGAALTLLSRGLATGTTTVYSGGSETISKGGTDIGARVSGGVQIDSGLASSTVIVAGSQLVRSGGTAIGAAVSSGGTEIVSSGGKTSATALQGGQEILSRGGVASGTLVQSGGREIVSSGGSALATKISGGTLEVAAGGTASGVVFSSGGTLQLDSSSHLSGTISGFHLGDAIDVQGLAFNASSSTLSWTQKATGTKASGTLTVKEGSQTQSFTLLGSYTVANFSATSDGHGGTLITDPPVTSGGSVATNAEITSGSKGVASFVSGVIQVAERIEDAAWNPGSGTVDPANLSLQWLENFAASVVSDLEGLNSTSGFQQLLNEIEGWRSSSGSGSAPSDQFSPSGHLISGFAAGWQSHAVQTLASFADGKGGPTQETPFQSNEQALQGYLAMPHQS